MEQLQSALSRCESVLGTDYVITEGDQLERANHTTFATEQRVRAILQPADTAEVQACLRIAQETETPIYPVSRGRNFGYGARVPASGDAVLLELKRMNRIIEFDEDLAYAVVEPGVTFIQFYNFLEQRGSQLSCGITGGPMDGSLIGNRLDRGQCVGGGWDVVQPAYDWEVVLPCGDLIHTGLGRYRAMKAGHVQPFAPGPDFSGLFEQAGLGVVTRMTLGLARKPKDRRVVVIKLGDTRQLREVIAPIREMLLDGVIRERPVFTNAYRIAAAQHDFQYPWNATSGKTPLPDSFLDGCPQWTGVITLLSENAKIGRERQRIVKRALKPKVDSLHLGLPEVRQLLKWTAPLSRLIAPAVRQFEAADKFIQAALAVAESEPGRPTGAAMDLPYWRKRGPIPETRDLDRDGCGLLWYSPVVPAASDDISYVARVIRQTCLRHKFEPFMNCSFWTERAAIFLVSIIYDREVPGEDERAKKCYEELFQRLTIDDGYVPYRLSISSMEMMPSPHDNSSALVQTLKQALDPADILSKGRYDFRHTWSDAP